MSVYIDNIILFLQAVSKSLYSTARITSWTSSGCIRCLICHFLRELLLNSNNNFAIFWVEWRFEWRNWPLKFWVDSSRVEWHFGFHAMVFTLSLRKLASWVDSTVEWHSYNRPYKQHPHEIFTHTNIITTCRSEGWYTTETSAEWRQSLITFCHEIHAHLYPDQMIESHSGHLYHMFCMAFYLQNLCPCLHSFSTQAKWHSKI